MKHARIDLVFMTMAVAILLWSWLKALRNLATSKKFYVDGLGWKPAFENQEIILFQTGGMVFALFLLAQLAADFPDERPSPWRIMFGKRAR